MGRLQPPRTSGYATDSVYASSCTLAIVLLGSVEEERSAWGRGEMIPGPMDFRGAHHGARWLQEAQQRAHGLRKAHRNDTEKSVCRRPKSFFLGGGGDHIKILKKPWHFSLKTFFSEMKSKSGQICGIFPVCFGVHKTGDA